MSANLAAAIITFALIFGAAGGWGLSRLAAKYEIRILKLELALEQEKNKAEPDNSKFYKHHAHNTSHALWDIIALYIDAKADLEAAVGKMETGANIAKVILENPRAEYKKNND
jgi:hypothetical protein